MSLTIPSSGILSGVVQSNSSVQVSKKTCHFGHINWTVKVEPWSTSLLTVIVPPIPRKIVSQMNKPSPIPCPAGFVVKNAWKRFAWIESGIPTPESWNSTNAFDRFVLDLISIVFLPFGKSLTAWIALSIRLINTWHNWPEWPVTMHSVKSVTTLTPSRLIFDCSTNKEALIHSVRSDCESEPISDRGLEKTLRLFTIAIARSTPFRMFF